MVRGKVTTVRELMKEAMEHSGGIIDYSEEAQGPSEAPTGIPKHCACRAN